MGNCNCSSANTSSPSGYCPWCRPKKYCPGCGREISKWGEWHYHYSPPIWLERLDMTYRPGQVMC